MKRKRKSLNQARKKELLGILQKRFEKNMKRHKDIRWEKVLEKLESNSEKLWSLNKMEETDGEPDVIGYDTDTDEVLFVDCSSETPKGRRSICYDPEALESRKQNKPKNSALGMAADMGVDILSEEQYRLLQQFGPFDTKTSSWLKTPSDIRDRGGAIFGDWRYGHMFVYHNGAESYFADRGFRACLKL